MADAPAGTVRPNAFSPPIAAAISGYCKVEGVIDLRQGVDGVAYGLRFELALPDDWNGRFLFQGGGGFNGTVNPALGSTAAGEVPAIARGYAVVSTDSGHASDAVFDGAFMRDQRAMLDFALHSVPTVSIAAKGNRRRLLRKARASQLYRGLLDRGARRHVGGTALSRALRRRGRRRAGDAAIVRPSWRGAR